MSLNEGSVDKITASGTELIDAAKKQREKFGVHTSVTSRKSSMKMEKMTNKTHAPNKQEKLMMMSSVASASVTQSMANVKVGERSGMFKSKGSDR